MNLYDWLRAGHIISFIAWMSGMMYLPRLFAYHTETAPVGSEFDAHFKVWEATPNPEWTKNKAAILANMKASNASPGRTDPASSRTAASGA